LGEERRRSNEEYYWLPRALSYFADKEVRQFNIIDRLANAVNEEVALNTLYDAMRTLKTIITSNKVEEVRRFVRKFGELKDEGGRPQYCYEGKCPAECKKVGEECCCDAEALYKLAMREVDDLKHSFVDEKSKKKAFLTLKIIAINALG